METHSISDVAAELRAGGVVAFPTETFFGLGADPKNTEGVEALLSLKGREISIGIPLITDSVESLEKIIGDESAEVRAARQSVLQKFWPGPLTIVIVPSRLFAAQLAKGIAASNGTLAIRQSSCKLAREIAAELDGFVTSTSANPKAAAPPKTAQLVRIYFPKLQIIDENTERFDSETLPSTILQVSVLPFKIVREGAISRAQLSEYLPKMK